MVRGGAVPIPGLPQPTGTLKTPGEVAEEKRLTEEATKNLAAQRDFREKADAAAAKAKAAVEAPNMPQPKVGFFKRPLNWAFRSSKKAGRRKSQKLGNKFNRCVKSVRKTVRARKGSSKESAAIAICTKSVLHPRGRTMKRYRKKHLVTQRKFRGGMWCS